MGLLALALLLLLSSATPAAAASVGDQVELKARHESGVPIHREPRSSMFARALDGSIATVLEVREHWHRIRVEEVEGWITDTYIGRVLSPAPACAYTAAPGGPAIADGWEAARDGVLCLEGGVYRGPEQMLAPPIGLGPVTVRALGDVTIHGEGEHQPLELVDNDIVFEGIRFCVTRPDGTDRCAVWSRGR